MKIYHYPKCSTCKQALAYLDSKKIAYQAIDISKTPPSKSELKAMYLATGSELRKLFNTSGKVYREGGYKDKIKDMNIAEAIALLHANGMLIKRPFVISNRTKFVGFGDDQKEKLTGW